MTESSVMNLNDRITAHVPHADAIPETPSEAFPVLNPCPSFQQTSAADQSRSTHRSLSEGSSLSGETDSSDEDWEDNDEVSLLDAERRFTGKRSQAEHTPTRSQMNCMDVVERTDDFNPGDEVEEDGIERDVGAEQLNPPINKKNNIQNQRIPVDLGQGKRSEKWIDQLNDLSEVELRRTACCKKLKCFNSVNYEHFINRARHILLLPVYMRRTVLQSMRGANGNYFFDGTSVCVRFLKKGFHFSTGMISSDRTFSISGAIPQPHTDSSSQHHSVLLTQRPTTSAAASPNVSSRHVGNLRLTDTVLSSLKRLSEDCSDKMPDSGQLHLPFFRKSEVYTHFVVEFKRLY